MEWMISQNQKVRKNQRLTAYDPETDEVYMNASLFGNPASLMLCMSFDGINAIMMKKEIYCPVSWLTREFPKHETVINDAANMVRDFFNNKKKEQNND
jgi:hypothetical protein